MRSSGAARRRTRSGSHSFERAHGVRFAFPRSRVGGAVSAYPHLFSPLQIGSITVRNRIMQTAHVKLFAHNAVDSQRNVAYQAARAKGGAGLLITGNRVVHPTSTTGFPRVAW